MLPQKCYSLKSVSHSWLCTESPDNVVRSCHLNKYTNPVESLDGGETKAISEGDSSGVGMSLV